MATRLRLSMAAPDIEDGQEGADNGPGDDAADDDADDLDFAIAARGDNQQREKESGEGGYRLKDEMGHFDAP
jgi:hypothetical protein